jgi:hypothetical protein
MAGNGLKFAVNETVPPHPVVASAGAYNSFWLVRKERVDGMERDEKRKEKWPTMKGSTRETLEVMNAHLFVLSPAESVSPPSSSPSSDRVVSPYLLDLAGDS